MNKCILRKKQKTDYKEELITWLGDDTFIHNAYGPFESPFIVSGVVNIFSILFYFYFFGSVAYYCKNLTWVFVWGPIKFGK